MGLDQGGLDRDSIGPLPVSVMVFVLVTSKFYEESFVRTTFFLIIKNNAFYYSHYASEFKKE